jgi:hypothetical protein
VSERFIEKIETPFFDSKEFISSLLCVAAGGFKFVLSGLEAGLYGVQTFNCVTVGIEPFQFGSKTCDFLLKLFFNVVLGRLRSISNEPRR